MKLTKVIDERGLRRDWIAKQAGVHPSEISKLERGVRLGRRATREKIAAVLGMTVEELFDGNEDAA